MHSILKRYVPVSGSYPHTYFAGANTAEGFVSAYPHWVREEESHRVFFIKGGSGTGKSSMMKQCARAAADVGAEITLLLCSSDPTSADGVILQGRNGRRIVILDGTAPHIADPALPGAAGEIVDVGTGWDVSRLCARREEICLARRGKAACYARAYRYLSAYRSVVDGASALLSECILHDKLYAAADRLLGTLKDRGRFSEEIVYTHALSMHGAYRLNTFSALAEGKCAIVDVYGTGEFFLEALRDRAMDHRRAVCTSPTPACPNRLQELYFPQAGLHFCLVPEREEGDAARYIHMHRFIDRSALAARRGKIRFAGKCADMLIEGALQALADAGEQHFRLEEIYKEAMDFSIVERKTASLAEYIGNVLG